LRAGKPFADRTGYGDSHCFADVGPLVVCDAVSTLDSIQLAGFVIIPEAVGIDISIGIGLRDGETTVQRFAVAIILVRSPSAQTFAVPFSVLGTEQLTRPGIVTTWPNCPTKQQLHCSCQAFSWLLVSQRLRSASSAVPVSCGAAMPWLE